MSDPQPLPSSPVPKMAEAIVLVERLEFPLRNIPPAPAQITESPPVSAVNVPTPPVTLPAPTCKPEIEEVPNEVCMTVKSNLGILSSKRIVRAKCPTESTWLEFFQTFQAYITHPEHYYILGKGGRTAQLDTPVREYIKQFDKPLPVYAVSLEPESRKMVVPPKRIRVKPSKLTYGVQETQIRRRRPVPRARPGVARPRPGPLCSKFSVGVKAGQREPIIIGFKNTVVSREQAQIACSPQYPSPTPTSVVMKHNSAPAGQVYRNVTNPQRRNSAVIDANNKIIASRSMSSTPQPQELPAAAATNGNMPWNKSPMYSPASSNASNGGRSSLPGQPMDMSSDPQFSQPRPDYFNNAMSNSGPDFKPTAQVSSVVEQPEVIKSYAIEFLQRKVSNEDIKVVHQEIMRLKQNGDYFQLTRKAPLAAGLLEQLLCPPMMYLERQRSDEQSNFQ